eukprot:16427491-Heterocapsa_arctica.AAC.1
MSGGRGVEAQRVDQLACVLGISGEKLRDAAGLEDTNGDDEVPLPGDGQGAEGELRGDVDVEPSAEPKKQLGGHGVAPGDEGGRGCLGASRGVFAGEVPLLATRGGRGFVSDPSLHGHAEIFSDACAYGAWAAGK